MASATGWQHQFGLQIGEPYLRRDDRQVCGGSIHLDRLLLPATVGDFNQLGISLSQILSADPIRLKCYVGILVRPPLMYKLLIELFFLWKFVILVESLSPKSDLNKL